MKTNGLTKKDKRILSKAPQTKLRAFWELLGTVPLTIDLICYDLDMDKAGVCRLIALTRMRGFDLEITWLGPKQGLLDVKTVCYTRKALKLAREVLKPA